MKYSELIKSDIELIKENANFNAEQLQIFEALIHPSYGVTKNDAAIYTNLCISERKFYRIKAEIKRKIERIFAE